MYRSSTFPRTEEQLKACMRESEGTIAEMERREICTKTVQREVPSIGPFGACKPRFQLPIRPSGIFLAAQSAGMSCQIAIS